MVDAAFSQLPALGHSCILIATPVIKSARAMAAVPERTRIMTTTVEPVHKMADTPTRVEPDTRLKRVSGTDKALLPSTSIIRVIRVNICARIEYKFSLGS